MPQVGGKQFPYSAKGRKDARKALLATGKFKPTGKNAKFNPDAFRERMSGKGGGGLREALTRQQGRVTPGGRDFAERKVAILQRKLKGKPRLEGRPVTGNVRQPGAAPPGRRMAKRRRRRLDV